MRRSIFLLLTILSASWGYCTEVTIGFGKDRAPYVMSKLDKGIAVDIFRAALSSQGYTVKAEYFPAFSAPLAIEKRVDAIAITHDPDDRYFISDYYLAYRDCIITKADSGIEIEELEDMMGHRITAWPGAYKHLGKEYHALFSPNNVKVHSPDYFEHESQLAQNQMFWRDRTDIIVIDEYIFHWYRHALRHTEDTQAPVNIHYLFPDVTQVQAAFKSEQLRDDFNAGIQTLRSSGEYQQILKSYLGDSYMPANDWLQASKGQTVSEKQPKVLEASDKSAEKPIE